MCTACSDRAPLCEACRSQRVTWMRGAAFARGTVWARRARVAGWRGAWPTWAEAGERWRARALDLVRDLTGGDAELGAVLAAECLDAAAAEWLAPAPRAGVPFAAR